MKGEEGIGDGTHLVVGDEIDQDFKGIESEKAIQSCVEVAIERRFDPVHLDDIWWNLSFLSALMMDWSLISKVICISFNPHF